MSSWKCICCQVWPFGKSLENRYSRILNEVETCPERWESEIKLGLPPGVTVGDLLKNKQNGKCMEQAYLLAVESNIISEHLRRFNSSEVPQSCKATVEGQVAKLKAMQEVIWNTMILLAVGGITISEKGLKELLQKQADDVMTLTEMEKLAAVMSMDKSGQWAEGIARVVSEQPKGLVCDASGVDNSNRSESILKSDNIKSDMLPLML